MVPRHNNYIWEQLAADELWASIIADGHHLPATVLRCFLRVKTPARLILTCDAGSLAGLPPGKYREWDQEFEVHPAGKIVMPGTDYLAGSWAFTDRCVQTIARLGEIALADAIDMASAQPRRLLGLSRPQLDPGKPAEFILFDTDSAGEFRLRATVVGTQIYPAD
jgi:N-acetylglucosamine-6-phosphate deacetylase